jgi:hypothetical protein
MSNMSYCRFENTSGDLYDCYEALQDGIDEDEMSDEEVEGYHELLRLCKAIAKDFA